MAGMRSRPCFCHWRSCFTPVVVSSDTPRMSGSSSGCCSCTTAVMSPPSSSSRFGPRPSGQASVLLDAPPVLLLRLTLPGEDGDAGGGDRRRRLVLRGEDVAGRPPDVRAELDERLDQHGGLNGHVEAAGDPGPVERTLTGVALTQRHQAGHLVLGEVDLPAAELGEGQVVGPRSPRTGTGARTALQRTGDTVGSWRGATPSGRGRSTADMLRPELDLRARGGVCPMRPQVAVRRDTGRERGPSGRPGRPSRASSARKAARGTVTAPQAAQVRGRELHVQEGPAGVREAAREVEQGDLRGVVRAGENIDSPVRTPPTCTP